MRTLALQSAVAVLALSGLVALPLAFAGARQERSDCPGKVVCPLTGEEVCKDRCPLTAKARKTDSTRPDCPGQVDCPLTGELVCRDECPVTDAASSADAKQPLVTQDEDELPPCCRNKNR